MGIGLTWGTSGTPPRNGGAQPQHEDAAVSTLLCDENLYYDNSVCHSPRYCVCMSHRSTELDCCCRVGSVFSNVFVEAFVRERARLLGDSEPACSSFVRHAQGLWPCGDALGIFAGKMRSTACRSLRQAVEFQRMAFPRAGGQRAHLVLR